MASKHRVTVGEELRYDSDVQGLKNLGGTYAPRSKDLTGGATGGIARLIEDKVGDEKGVKDFGALGDGTTDDTTALQNALTWMAGGAGRSLFLPAGTYRITSSLTIPFATGWRLRGSSRGSTKIRQATNNTPILTMTGNLTHSWVISDLTFDWASAQTSAQTSAVAIYFATGTGNDSIFNWQIKRCTFTNGFRSIAVATTNVPLLWGVHISDCVFGGSMKGAAFSAAGAGTGLPNINIENCYIDCTGATEASIAFSNGDNVVLRNLEFNNGAYGGPGQPVSQIALGTCYPVTLIGCKSEAVTCAASPGLWDFSQCDVIAIGCSINGVVGSATNPTFIKAGSGGSLAVHGMNFVAALTTGSLVPYQADRITQVGNLRSSGTVARDPITVLGNVTQPGLNLDVLTSNRTQARGDTSVTLTSSDYRVQYFNTTLTANRTVTLPNSGLVDGMEFEIVRQDTGAFTLAVSDPVSGKSYTLPSGTKGFSRWRARSSSEWMLMAAGTF